MSKISFKNESKHIPGFPLNKIETIGKFQDLNEEAQFKQNRNNKIDYYYYQLDDIRKNKVRSGLASQASRKIKESEIKEIYMEITGNKPKNGQLKNDLIDVIDDFYTRKYIPRHTRQAGGAINISDNSDTKDNNNNAFGVTTNHNLNQNNYNQDSESESDDEGGI